MEFVQPQPTTRAPSDWFTGDVWFDVIYAGRRPSRMRANPEHLETTTCEDHGHSDLYRPFPAIPHRREEEDAT